MAKPRRFTWLLIAIVAISMIGGAVFGPVIRQNQPSTLDSSSMGMKAFYILLRKEGVPVRRWHKTLDQLDDSVRVAVTAESLHSSFPVGAAEVESLLSWVSRGGTLIFFPTPGSRIARSLEMSIPDRKSAVLLEELARMSWVRHRPSLWNEITEASQSMEKGECLDPGQNLRTRKEMAFSGGPKDLRPHAKNSRGIVYATMPKGRGRMFFLSDPFVLSNLGLRHPDNAGFAVCLGRKLQEWAAAGTVAFDEYHHGYASEAQFSAFAKAPSAESLFFQAVLLVLASLAAFMPRFGMVIFGPPRKERRAKEFVESLGRLYFNRGLRADAARIISEDFRRRLCKTAGYPTGVPWSELKPLSGRLFGRSDLPDVIARYLNSFTTDRRWSRRSFLAFHRLIHHLRMRV